MTSNDLPPPPRPPPPPPPGAGGAASGFSVLEFIGGFGAFVVATPFAFIWTIFAQGVLGALLLLAATGLLVAWLVTRTRFRSLGMGIAAGYVAATLVTGGICTGWNSTWV